MGTTLLTYTVNCHVMLKAAIVSAVWGSNENEINKGYGDGSLAGCFYLFFQKTILTHLKIVVLQRLLISQHRLY